MKVSELIDKLNKCPPDYDVQIDPTTGNYEDADYVFADEAEEIVFISNGK